MEPAEFWKKHGLSGIIPNVGSRFPEGFDVKDSLLHFLGDYGDLVEFGCGDGRLAEFFPTERYTGVDISPQVLEQARKTLPDHDFRLISETWEIPEATTILAYTVLLHVPDERIRNCIQELSKHATNKVIVVEIMDYRWRAYEGAVPVFNRDVEHYIMMFQRAGLNLTAYRKEHYARYAKWSRDLDHQMTFLEFVH